MFWRWRLRCWSCDTWAKAGNGKIRDDFFRLCRQPTLEFRAVDQNDHRGPEERMLRNRDRVRLKPGRRRNRKGLARMHGTCSRFHAIPTKTAADASRQACTGLCGPQGHAAATPPEENPVRSRLRAYSLR